MRCYLVRHAQTLWNDQNRFQGRTDSPLSPLGLKQVERLADYFAARPIKTIYTSDLPRTIHTASAIAQRTRAMPRIEPALAEIDLGAWEGLTPDEIDARFNGAYQIWRMTPSKLTIPGGEPLGMFRARVRHAFARIVADRHDPEVLIVSHGGVIASLLADWLHADYDQLLQQLVLNNAGVSAVEWERASCRVLWVNETGHLLA